jgi:hypothetical protein
MSLLGDLFVKYGTDKGIWGYTPYYEAIMEKQRFEVKRVLEVGICGYRDIPNNVVGASLYVWRDYFPNAEIFGIDNDMRFMLHGVDRITTRLCNAYHQDALHACLIDMGGLPFDMVVDDAVHDPAEQIQLANQLANWMHPGAHYFMEDVCPYKMMDGDLNKGLYDHLTGFRGVCAGSTPKPEVLVMGIK